MQNGGKYAMKGTKESARLPRRGFSLQLESKASTKSLVDISLSSLRVTSLKAPQRVLGNESPQKAETGFYGNCPRISSRKEKVK